MYDEKRFHVAINVTRGDAPGRILKRMANGMVVSFETIEEASKAQLDFITDARLVIEGMGRLALAKFVAYGATYIQDRGNARIHSMTALRQAVN